MLLKYRRLIFFGFVGLFSLSMAMEKSQKENIFDLVAKEHQLAINENDREKEPFALVFNNKDGTPRDPSADEFIRREFEENLYETYRNQFIGSCNIIKQSKYFPTQYEHLEIDEATRADLKILRGGPAVKDGSDCLANKVNKTKTFAGRTVLCAQLTKPAASADQLIARNKKIEALVTSPKFNDLEAHIKKASEGESNFLSFFSPGDRFEEHLMRSKRKIMGAEKLAGLKRFENWLNDNPLYLTWQEAEPVILSVPGMLLSNGIKVFDLGNIFLGPNKLENCVKFCKRIGIEAINPVDKPVITVAEKFCPKLFVNFLKCVFGAKGIEQQADGITNTRLMLGYQFAMLKYMRKKLYYTSKMVRAFKDTQTSLDQINKGPNGRMLVNLQLPQSVKAKQTIELLTSSTFDQDDDSWLAYWGKIKLSYKRVCETKNEFQKTYAALGELDYLMGSARLIRDNPAPLIRDSTQKAKYSLATFAHNIQTPALQAKNGWNPFLKKDERCVPNNANLADKDGKKILIITGPNRQGKTVFMNMILYSALMSQAMGVVPAQEFSLAPYHHLITFVKTETNTSKGQSLFENTCERGNVVIDTLKKGSGLKLFGTDEPFSGTKHDLALSTGAIYMKEIGDVPKVNGMITTHLKSVTRLPASYPIHFMNLKVYNHHVEPGIGYCQTEDEGLKIIEEKFGKPFADAVKKDMQLQTVHEYLENQNNLDRLVQEARQEYQALRLKVGAPILDGMIINLADPQLRADWEQKINNPPIAEIRTIANRLKIDQFERFFDLLERVAIIGQLHPETQQQTFKDLMLTIMAHCADAAATAQSAPWLERIRHIEGTIRQEHERRATLQQEINALLSIRNQEPLAEQLQTEKRTLTALTAQKEDALEDAHDLQDELSLMQRVRQLQYALEQQNQEFLEAIEQTRRDLQPLQIQLNASALPHTNN